MNILYTFSNSVNCAPICINFKLIRLIFYVYITIFCCNINAIVIFLCAYRKLCKFISNLCCKRIERYVFWLVPFLFAGCHEQGYAGNIIVYGICVRSIDIWTRCSASHIQIGPRLACLNLLAMQPSTPISAYHHIKIIHTRIHTHDYIMKIQYTHTVEFLYSKVIRIKHFL